MLSKTLRTLGFIALLLLPSFAGAEQAFFNAYDLNDTTYTYGRFGVWTVASPSRIETSGSSTTVTAVSGTPFELVGVGDHIRVTIAGVLTSRIVTAVASSISITVNSAINLDIDGGYQWEWRDFQVGTAATDGWFQIPVGTESVSVYFIIAAMTGTDGIAWTVECKGDGDITTAVVQHGETYAAAGSEIVNVTEVCPAIRVGIKWVTADTAGTDSVTAFLLTR